MSSPTIADTLVLHIDWLITVDGTRRVIRDAGVAINGGTFCALGKSLDIAESWVGRQVLDGRGKVGVPGLIDSHLHSSFQLARGLADEVGTRAFLFQHMFPFEGALSEEDVYVSSLFTAMSLLRAGVTCFIDPGNYHPNATALAVLASGMRAILGRSAFDMGKAVLGVLPQEMIETTDQALDRTRALVEFVDAQKSPRLKASISFRGMSNSSDKLIVALKELARQKSCIFQTHACFNYSTHDDCLASFGVTEIERLEKLGVLDESTLLAHSGWLEPSEVEVIVRRRPNLVSAPSSSFHNGYGNFTRGRLPELMEMGVNVGIGSDHACSGFTDLVREMFLFAGAYKEIHMNPRVVPPESAVEMATINGARCAGLSDRLGSIEVGKDADLTLFDTTFPEWQPLFNPVSNLVYSATGNSVSDVLVAGEHVVSKGRLVKIDESEVLKQVADAMLRIDKKLNVAKLVKLRWPVS
jgi:5-methylthioadenosine/S-adenosylhomocysteine deaminase